MKLILLGLVLLAAWDAGFGLLMGCCLAALLLVHSGRQNSREGHPVGQGRIKLGIGLGLTTLAVALLKLAFFFLAWVSLTKVFPTLLPTIKALWAHVTSL